jgi:poly(glycerol-phosphate) alpha-glucosyltransferase
VKVGLVTASVSRSGAGVSEAVRSLAIGLNSDVENTVTVFGVEDENTRADLPFWNDVSLHTFRSQGPKVFGYAPDMSGALQTASMDILHGHGFWTYSSTACRRWSHRSRRPYLISPHGTLRPWALQSSIWKKRLAAWGYENRNLADAACLHALNLAEAESIRVYGLRNPIAVVPNGITLTPASDVLGAAPWDGVVEAGKKALLFLGRLNPIKNLPSLLRAWGQLQSTAQAKSWQLVIAGWSQWGHMEELQALARELGIQGSVSLIGPLHGHAKAAAFRHASAFILPSHSEGMPMAVLEAWASSTPVIMTPECNLGEGFAAGAAIRVEPDCKGIAVGLAQLFDMSGTEVRKMGERGRMLAEERFASPVVARQMTELYKWALGGGKAPSFVLTD